MPQAVLEASGTDCNIAIAAWEAVAFLAKVTGHLRRGHGERTKKGRGDGGYRFETSSAISCIHIQTITRYDAVRFCEARKRRAINKEMH